MELQDHYQSCFGMLNREKEKFLQNESSENRQGLIFVIGNVFIMAVALSAQHDPHAKFFFRKLMEWFQEFRDELEIKHFIKHCKDSSSQTSL